MDDFFGKIGEKYNSGLHASKTYEKAITTLGNMAAEINTGHRPSQVVEIGKEPKEDREIGD